MVEFLWRFVCWLGVVLLICCKLQLAIFVRGVIAIWKFPTLLMDF